MSDEFSKTGLSSGSSWSLLTENTAFEEPDTVAAVKQDNSASATRLYIQDSNKFGLCPARESLQLTVCKQCQKLVLLFSLYRHYELHHRKFLSTVKPSPPKRCIPSSTPPLLPKLSSSDLNSKESLLSTNTEKSFIRIEQVNPNELNVKIEEVPLTIPQFNSTVTKGKLPRINVKKIINECKKANSPEVATSTPVVSPQVCIQVKGSFKKIPHLKEKEYDVDKHCGVWIPEMEKNCTRSLTCKTHPLSLRRQVPGRSKDFDVLLAEHRARVALKIQENTFNSTPSPLASSTYGTPMNSPLGFDKIVFPAVRGPSSNIQKDTAGSSIKLHNRTLSSKLLSEEGHKVAGESSQVLLDYISDETIKAANLPNISAHPKPISVNTFGGRQTDCKCRVFSRRMDHFRNATSSMLDRYNNCASTFASMNPLDPTKVGKDGLKLAVQDPLQNGILYKQKNKSCKVSGTKRQLSVSETQGIMADSINFVTSSKRKHSSDISVGDPFAMANPPNISRSLSYPSHSGQNLIKVKELQSSSVENNLICHRPKSRDSLTNNVATNSSDYLIISTSGTNEKLSATIGTGNLNLNSNLNLCYSLGITSTESSVNSRQKSFDATFSLSKISAAPNVTITQGIIVSLPSAVLQDNPQNIYTIGTQIKDLLTDSSPPPRTMQHVSTPTTSPALKKVLADPHLTSFPNGIDLSRKKYNSSFSSSAKDEVAPNITVTASSSLTGVLQGHVVSATLSTMPKTTFKRLNSVHTDQADLLQQLVQHNNSNRDLQQSLDSYKQSLPNRSSTATQSLFSSSVSSCNNQVVSRPSFISSPSNANSVNNMQPMKHLQKMQRQQLQQQQLQGQQFLVHHGYQQQILPKLPTVSNNMTQYNSQQFDSSGGQGNLQFLSQATNSNSMPQHGGTLS